MTSRITTLRFFTLGDEIMSTRWIVLLMAVMACSCTSLQIFPREAELVTGTENPVPVTIRLAWTAGSVGMGPIVEVDGIRIPESALAYTDSGATVVVPLRPGPHVVRARTAQLCAICLGRAGQFDLTHQFYVSTSATTVSLR